MFCPPLIYFHILSNLFASSVDPHTFLEAVVHNWQVSHKEILLGTHVSVYLVLLNVAITF